MYYLCTALYYLCTALYYLCIALYCVFFCVLHCIIFIGTKLVVSTVLIGKIEHSWEKQSTVRENRAQLGKMTVQGDYVIAVDYKHMGGL